ncbi:hypothetical protein J3A83DRAFT_4404617 [Scleroderma citrinum]
MAVAVAMCVIHHCLCCATSGHIIVVIVQVITLVMMHKTAIVEVDRQAKGCDRDSRFLVPVMSESGYLWMNKKVLLTLVNIENKKLSDKAHCFKGKLRQEWGCGDGISMAMANIDFKNLLSSVASVPVEREWTMARRGMMSDNVPVQPGI